ncbi:hypothetical protein A3N63_21275 [Klebsiella aerogenes]|uniref:hypothetical protein n=1 Tax=Klebsiella aerogenes TaxID=548 RepID=UPI0007B3DB00|nr:hypothetical protein [Klebsiella aerogenes]KZR04289.1 hypothetical protein A3N63_21275 [Klebsiella aerogenes]
MTKTITDEELNVLIEKAQSHSEVMSELGSEQEVEESCQILSTLCEMKQYREGDAHWRIEMSKSSEVSSV